MADLNYVQATLETKIIGQDSSGNNANYVGADSSGNMTVKDFADGTPGSAVPSVSTLVGGSDGTNLRSLSTDSTGRLNVNNIQKNGTTPTYSAASQGFVAPSLATDIFQIKGSGTKTISIKNITISGTRTTAGVVPVNLIKRSTSDTGGGDGSIVQFQQTSNTTNNATAAITVTSTGAGNLIVIGAVNSDNRTITGISDGTNSFTQATGAAGASTTTKSDIWYLLSSTAGKTTFTVTYNGNSTTKSVFFWEVAGSGAAFDVANKVNNGVAVLGTDTGGAVTNGGSAFIAAVINTSVTITASPAAGNEFTTSGGISSLGDAGCSLLTNTIASHTPAWTDSGPGVFASSTASFLISGSGGTSITSVPHDSTNSAATAVVDQYAALPILGTAVGTVRASQLFFSTSTSQSQTITWTFDNNPDQAIVLRGANETLALNLGGTTIAGSNISMYAEWTEE